MITLAFVTTTECNLSCQHCLRGNAAPSHLSFDIIKKTITEAKKFGIENIHLTGGEPFLYQGLSQVFQLAQDEGLALTFSSNGLFLSKESQLIEKYKKTIKFINISLESSVASIHEITRGPGSFQKVCAAFAFCRAQKVPFGITTCLHKFNIENLADVVRFARRQKARHINFTTVLPCSKARENNLILDESQRTKVYQELKRLAWFASLDGMRLFYVPVYIAETLYASNNIAMCGNQSLRSVTVDVDGSLHFCCFLTVYDVPRDVEKKLKIASLQHMSFDEGLKLFTETMQRFISQRIDDYAVGPHRDSLDFNSCFYCNKKLGL